MKKLKLKAFELGANEVLTRAQLKNVLGGSAAGTTLINPGCGINKFCGHSPTGPIQYCPTGCTCVMKTGYDYGTCGANPPA